MRPVLLLVLFAILCRAHAKHLTTSFYSNSTVITTVISTWWPQVWPSDDHSHDHLILSVLFMKSDWGQSFLPDLCCTICPNQMFKLHLFSSLAGHRACFFLYPVIRSYTPCCRAAMYTPAKAPHSKYTRRITRCTGHFHILTKFAQQRFDFASRQLRLWGIHGIGMKNTCR